MAVAEKLVSGAVEQAERITDTSRWLSAEKADLFALIKSRADAMASGDPELVAQNPVENIKRVQGNIKIAKDILKEFDAGVQSSMALESDEDED